MYLLSNRGMQVTFFLSKKIIVSYSQLNFDHFRGFVCALNDTMFIISVNLTKASLHK